MSSDMYARIESSFYYYKRPTEFLSRLLIHSIYINSYYEEEQSILNYIMSNGRRNSYEHRRFDKK
jgi:hypothetical protein